MGFLGYGVGVRNIIADKFTFNMGMKLRISKHLISSTLGSQPEDYDTIEYAAKDRVAEKQFINFVFGLGYLL